MTAARKEVVNAMVDAAIFAMETEVPSSTSSEVVSAALTLALRTVQATLELHPDQRDAVREAVSLLMLACSDSKAN